MKSKRKRFFTAVKKSNIKKIVLEKRNGKYYMKVVWFVICPECIEMGITESESPYYELNKKEFDWWRKWNG